MSSFPQFLLLPLELQLRIWHYSLPAPRIVDLFAHTISSSLQPTPNSPPPSNPSSYNAITRSSSDLHHSSWTWVRYYTERVYTPPQPFVPLLHVCHEARQVVLRNYVKINADMDIRAPGTPHDRPMDLTPLKSYSHGDGRFEEDKAGKEQGRFYLATLKGNRPFALLDPKMDILFLQDPPRQRDRLGAEIMSNLATLIRWLDVEVLRNLKRLALPYYTWHKSNTLGFLHLLLAFEELEELYVSFLGGVPVCAGAMWADQGGVEELGSHVKEVAEEVMSDVEGLKRSFPEWRKPTVKIVKHMGIVTKELES